MPMPSRMLYIPEEQVVWNSLRRQVPYYPVSKPRAQVVLMHPRPPTVKPKQTETEKLRQRIAQLEAQQQTSAHMLQNCLHKMKHAEKMALVLLRKNMELNEKLDAAHRVMGRDTIADPAYGTPARRRRGVRQGAYRSM